jgi:hypothetical protein
MICQLGALMRYDRIEYILLRVSVALLLLLAMFQPG